MVWTRFGRPIRCAAMVPCILFLGLAGCAQESSATDDVSGSLAALVGGTTDTADPAVVVIEMSTSTEAGGCTASFIDRNVLLTAAHCLTDERGRVPASSKYRVYMGADLKAATASDWIEVQTKNVHPHPRFNSNTSVNDVGVLVLDKPVDVAPLPINTKALAQDMIGAQVRLVGYGTTSGMGAGFGLRRTLTTTMRMLQSEIVLIGNTGQQACDGDSGGPALLKIEGVETIVGTDDYNSQGFNCTNGDYYQRVDRQLDFITPFLSTQPGSTGAVVPDAGAVAQDAGAARPSDAGAALPSDAAIPPQAPDAATSPVIGGAGAISPPGVAVTQPVDAGVATSPGPGVRDPNGAGGVSPPSVGIAPSQPSGGAMAAGYGAFAGAAASAPVIHQLKGGAIGCSVAPRPAHSGAAAFVTSALLFAFTLRRRRELD